MAMRHACGRGMVSAQELGGRPRIISAVELFKPLLRDSKAADPGCRAGTSFGMGGGGGGVFTPKLHGIPSGKVLERSIDEDAVDMEVATPNSTLSLASDATAGGGRAARGPPLCELLSNGVYVCVVLALSSLFFVVTGIQFWVTSYIIRIIKMPQAYVTPAFGATSILAPIAGVVCGGLFIDKIGGYKGAAALALTLKWCFVFASCAAACAITCAYIPKRIADGGDSVASRNAPPNSPALS
jgi:hypothetical protein